MYLSETGELDRASRAGQSECSLTTVAGTMRSFGNLAGACAWRPSIILEWLRPHPPQDLHLCECAALTEKLTWFAHEWASFRHHRDRRRSIHGLITLFCSREAHTVIIDMNEYVGCHIIYEFSESSTSSKPRLLTPLRLWQTAAAKATHMHKPTALQVRHACVRMCVCAFAKYTQHFGVNV